MSKTSISAVWYPNDLEVMATAVVQACKTSMSIDNDIDNVTMAKIVYRLYSMGLRDANKLAEVAALSAFSVASGKSTLGGVQH